MYLNMVFINKILLLLTNWFLIVIGRGLLASIRKYMPQCEEDAIEGVYYLCASKLDLTYVSSM